MCCRKWCTPSHPSGWPWGPLGLPGWCWCPKLPHHTPGRLPDEDDVTLRETLVARHQHGACEKLPLPAAGSQRLCCFQSALCCWDWRLAGLRCGASCVTLAVAAAWCTRLVCWQHMTAPQQVPRKTVPCSGAVSSLYIGNIKFRWQCHPGCDSLATLDVGLWMCGG